MTRLNDRDSLSRSGSALTRDAFERLLRWLDADRERAGEQYELIRRKLIKFFECRGSTSAEDDADDVITRVARRIEDGEVIDHRSGYFYGVARMVLLESSRRHRPDQLAPDSDPAAPAGADAEERVALDTRLTCLDACLASLASDNRQLVVTYYQGDHAVRIRQRRLLAERHGLPMNALRIRVHRLRTTLEACVRQCMQRSGR
jgi:DNA-directed RNA polymerase specialized sigma24 family protein